MPYPYYATKETDIMLNITPENKHIPEIRSSIRTI